MNFVGDELKTIYKNFMSGKIDIRFTLIVFKYFSFSARKSNISYVEVIKIGANTLLSRKMNK